jgi:signal transduction histidine kinase
LYLNHQIMNLYNDSVRVNQEWAGRLASFSQLREQAGAVNAPGNDVFHSRDVTAESADLRRERQQFDEQMADMRNELRHNLSEAAAVPFLGDLDAANKAMDEMVADAELIFASFIRNQPDRAGVHMAAMDRQYETLNAALGRLNHRVRVIQQAQFENQLAEAARWRKYEYVIAALIGLMVVSVTVYGNHLARSVTAAQREREKAEEGLRRAHDELEARVRERTADLEKANAALQIEIAERTQAEEQLRRSREQMRNLAARLQSAQEEERARIARDIHDEFGQVATGLKMDLSWLGSKLAQSDGSAPAGVLADKVKSMSLLLDTHIQWVRKMATELRPGVLDNLGLIAAIEWQAEEFQHRTGIQCLVSLPSDEPHVDRERSTALFRICQEILTNVARHAIATKINITMMDDGDDFVLEIADNGRGITEREMANPKSLGLLGMRERALLLGGEVSVQGIPGQGTTITVTIPIQQKQEGAAA